jgi:hypothetical protein
MKPICLSGGAKGADAQWGMCAGTAGHEVVHWSFADAKVYVPEAEVARLTDEQLEAANKACHTAAKNMNARYKAAGVKTRKSFQLNTPANIPDKYLYVRNLLRRNYYQVKDTERVYAVADIEDGMVSGGTAWAVQMFIDRVNGAACECYVFDQLTEQWYVWNGLNSRVRWNALESPPEPHGVWTGIGSRDLSTEGKEAIRTLLRYYERKTL